MFQKSSLEIVRAAGDTVNHDRQQIAARKLDALQGKLLDHLGEPVLYHYPFPAASATEIGLLDDVHHLSGGVLKDPRLEVHRRSWVKIAISKSITSTLFNKRFLQEYSPIDYIPLYLGSLPSFEINNQPGSFGIAVGLRAVEKFLRNIPGDQSEFIRANLFEESSTELGEASGLNPESNEKLLKCAAICGAIVERFAEIQT